MSAARTLRHVAAGLASIADGFASIAESFLPEREQRRLWEHRRGEYRRNMQRRSNARRAAYGLPPLDLTPPRTVAEAFDRDRAALAADGRRARGI